MQTSRTNLRALMTGTFAIIFAESRMTIQVRSARVVVIADISGQDTFRVYTFGLSVVEVIIFAVFIIGTNCKTTFRD